MILILTDQKSAFYRLGEVINESGDSLKRIKDYLYSNNKYYLFLLEQEVYRLYEASMYGVKFTPGQVICPPKMAFRFYPVKGKEEIINDLKQYASGEEVECIIHAGKPDAAGESGLRIPLGMLNIKKQMFRIWTSQLNKEYLKEQLKNPGQSKDYDRLASAGYAERYINWLWSVNVTQRIEKNLQKKNIQIKCMRMLPALLHEISKSEESENLQNTSYLVQSEQIYQDSLAMLTYPMSFNSTQYEKAEAIAAELNHDGVQLVDIEKKIKIKDRPRVYSFDELQLDMAKKYGFVPEYTMTLLKNLYDNGWISYPYTSSHFFKKSEMEDVENLLREIKDNGYNVEFNKKSSKFNESDTDVIGAIRPVGRIPTKQEFFEFSDDLKRCYNRIMLNFCAAFSKKDCKVEEIVYDFVSRTLIPAQLIMRGEKIKQEGYREFDSEDYVQSVPDLKKGTILTDLKFHVVGNKDYASEKNYCITDIVMRLFIAIHIFLYMNCKEVKNHNTLDYVGSLIQKQFLNALCILMDKGLINLEDQEYRLTDKGKELLAIFKEHESLTSIDAELIMLKNVLSVELGMNTTGNAVREFYQYLQNTCEITNTEKQ